MLVRAAAVRDMRLPSGTVTRSRWPSSSFLITVACPSTSGVHRQSHCEACSPQQWSGARGFDEDDVAQGDVFFPEAPSGPAVQWARGSDWAALDDSESSGDEQDAEGWEALTGEAVRTLSPRQQRTWQQLASQQRLTVRWPRLMRLAASCRTCILHCSAPAHHAVASRTDEMPHCSCHFPHTKSSASLGVCGPNRRYAFGMSS